MSSKGFNIKLLIILIMENEKTKILKSSRSIGIEENQKEKKKTINMPRGFFLMVLIFKTLMPIFN